VGGGQERPFGAPAERWRRPEGSGRRAAGRGRAGDLDLQGACGGLATRVVVGKSKDPAGHQQNAGRQCDAGRKRLK
jgi:hypothetical protein